ncbi:hypothetical protein [Rubrobacter indicoceani]|uniref:hypothetical protein n=1 Tax=Rubrobacter indicoceani TaxID=2051957 RepID=UPI000E5AFFFD|nr:hypothetical protein [Rubrobacter indicoceani]
MKVEAKLDSGIYALNRFMLTIQNKRMPIRNLDAKMRDGDTTVAFTFDCPPENARRYTILLDGLEDVREIGPVE